MNRISNKHDFEYEWKSQGQRILSKYNLYSNKCCDSAIADS